MPSRDPPRSPSSHRAVVQNTRRVSRTGGGICESTISPFLPKSLATVNASRTKMEVSATSCASSCRFGTQPAIRLALEERTEQATLHRNALGPLFVITRAFHGSIHVLNTDSFKFFGVVSFLGSWEGPGPGCCASGCSSTRSKTCIVKSMAPLRAQEAVRARHCERERNAQNVRSNPTDSTACLRARGPHSVDCGRAEQARNARRASMGSAPLADWRTACHRERERGASLARVLSQTEPRGCPKCGCDWVVQSSMSRA